MPASPEPALPPKPAPIDPRSLAERAFATTRRGFDPGEVRAHLRVVADQIRALQNHADELETRLRAAQAAPPPAPPPRELDVQQVASLVGEETARVLETAREASVEIRAKAEENATRLVREAADEASTTRNSADEYAAKLRREAEEEATATRHNADRYAAELRRATDAEIEETKTRAIAEADEVRRATEEHAASTRADAADYAGRVRADAEEYALATRAAADDDAARLRTEGHDEADRLRAEAHAVALEIRDEADQVLAVRREEAEAEAARILREAEAERERIYNQADGVVEAAEAEAAERVGEAEAARDRVLQDLSRRRKQAKAHLEQLEAARARLLRAYEVVRTTLDEATHELNVVLPEARAAATEALHRTTAEPDLTVDELEAELAAAREAGLGFGSDPRSTSAVSRLAGELDPEPAAAGEPGRSAGPASPPVLKSSGGAEEPDDEPASAPDDANATVGPGDDEAAEDADEGHERRRGGLFGRRRRDRAGAEHGVILSSSEAAPVGTVVEAPPEAATELSESGASPTESSEAEAETVDETGALEGTATAADHGAVDSGVVDNRAGGNGTVDNGAVDNGAVDDRSAEPDDHDPDEQRHRSENPVGALFARIRAGRDEAGGDETAAGEVEAPEPSVAAATGVGAVEPDDATSTAAEADDGGAAGRADQPADTSASAGDDGETADDRAPTAADGAPAAAADAPADDDPPAVAWRKRRDATLDGFEKRLARRLKRTLADEESQVLDRLRTAKGRPKVKSVLDKQSAVLQTYVDAALPLLREAAAEGASNVADIGAGEPPTGRVAADVSSLADELAGELNELLRPRVEHAIEEAAGGDDPVEELELADRVRACYREWRTQRLTELVQHALLTAFARGLYEAVPDGVELTWVVDDTGTPCPDCADNVLAGSVVRGSPFPTDHLCPPAHPGCRCFVMAGHL